MEQHPPPGASASLPSDAQHPGAGSWPWRGGRGTAAAGTGSSSSPSTRASTPQATEDQAVHPPAVAAGLAASASSRSVISLTANGSAHGGQHFFSSGANDEWRLGQAQERALEQHSLASNRHPASLPNGGSAGLAALQLAGEAPSRHQAVWVVEDGSTKGGMQPAAGRPPSRAGSRPPSRGGSRHGAGLEGSVKGGAPAGAFGGAVVKIEEPSEREVFEWGAYLGSLPKKLKGGLDTRLPIPSMRNIFWSWLGAFLGILAVSAMNQWLSPEIDIAFLVGSFGASAVLVFALLESKMSQPRNFIGGQCLSALVGITIRVIIHQTWIAAPVGMSLALVAMQLTATTHPPGGATALIACTLPTLPKWHGYSYLVTIAVGSCVMQLIALVVNNLDPQRRYPTFWY